MAQEPFLINPPRRLKRRRRNPVGEVLVTVGANPSRRNPMRSNPENPWYGDPGGHRIAALMRWGKIKRGSVKKFRRRGRPRVSYAGVAVKRHYKKRHVARKAHKRVHRTVVHKRMSRRRKYVPPTYSKYMIGAAGTGAGYLRRRHTPYTLFGVGRPGGKAFGHNPFIGRSITMRRRKRVKRNSWFGQPRRHRKAAKKGWRRGHKGVRRRHRRNYFTNPVVAQSNPRRRRRVSSRRRHRRSYRHNPAIGQVFGKFTSGISDVRGWAPLAVTGGLSAITGAVVPQLVGVVNPWAKLGTQLAVAIGGGIAVEQFVDKRHGQAWMIVGVSMVGYQLLKQFVFIPYLPQFAVGLGEYEDYSYRDGVSQEVGAYPQEISAFPGVSAYPGVGAEQEEVGSYPYDGSGY